MDANEAAPKVVLLVEADRPDSPAEALRRRGFEVVRRSRPTEAWSLLSGPLRCDVILCDDSLHPSVIRSLFEAARARNPVAVTGIISPDSSVEDADLAAAFSADRVIRIPLRSRLPLSFPGGQAG